MDPKQPVDLKTDWIPRKNKWMTKWMVAFTCRRIATKAYSVLNNTLNGDVEHVTREHDMAVLQLRELSEKARWYGVFRLDVALSRIAETLSECLMRGDGEQEFTESLSQELDILEQFKNHKLSSLYEYIP